LSEWHPITLWTKSLYGGRPSVIRIGKQPTLLLPSSPHFFLFPLFSATSNANVFPKLIHAVSGTIAAVSVAKLNFLHAKLMLNLSISSLPY